MKKLILAACLVVLASLAAFAQSSDYKKVEVFGGFSNGQIDTGADSGNDVRSFFNDRRSFNGFEASGVYNVHRYVGIKADFSGTYRNQSVTAPITGGSVRFDTNRSFYNVLGGVQIKDNSSDARIKPFAHVLAGVGHQKFKLKNVACTGVTCPTFITDASDTGFAGAIGGGLDVKVNDKVDIRAVQVDYNPARFDGGVQHNVRFGIGVVFK